MLNQLELRIPSDYCVLCFIFIDKPGKSGKPNISDITKDSVILAWSPPESDGGTPITNYIIEFKMKATTKWAKANIDDVVTDTMYTVRELKEGKEYMFRVTAENKVGAGPPSDATDSVLIKEPVGELKLYIRVVILAVLYWMSTCIVI